MATILYVTGILFLLLASLAIFKSLVNINELEKRIDEILDEERRQNKRIDILEKREQMRQLEQRRDQTFIQSKELFKNW